MQRAQLKLDSFRNEIRQWFMGRKVDQKHLASEDVGHSAFYS